MLRSIFVGLLTVVLLSGCTSTGTLTSSFNPSEAEFINRQGSATVIGQGFLRRNDGVVVYAAGSEVNLIPRTAYSQERIAQIYQGGNYSYLGRSFSNDDPRYYQYMKTVIADGEGRFTFNDVPPGEYYVATNVLWMAGYTRQGGAIMKPVSVSGSGTVNVIINGQ